MFLHAGNGKNIRQKDIIGIFDADTATVSGITKRFLTAAQKKNAVIAASDEVPKSFILYREKGDHVICFSQLSSVSLLGRAEEGIYYSAENKINNEE